MNIEATQEIAEALRALIGAGQATVLLDTGAQLPLEIVTVGRTTIKARATMQGTRVVLGTQQIVEIPWDYVIALDSVIGVGAQAGEASTQTLDAPRVNGKGPDNA